MKINFNSADRLLLLFSILFFNFKAFSNNTPMPDTILSKHIQTVLFYQTGKINTYPFIDINKPEMSLTLAFDDMRCGYQSYEYEIIYCNFDWTVSALYPDQYLDGPDYGYIENYNFSNNTYIRYTNYYFSFPQEGTWFKLTGNYVIVVYPSGRKNEPVLIRRFYVVSSPAKVTAEVLRPTQARYKLRKQEIDFEVNYSGLDVSNPLLDFKVCVRQNKRSDNENVWLQPMFVRNDILIYDYDEENLFDGLSEWRYVDLRPQKYPGPGVHKIILDSFYNYYLMVDEDRSYLGYSEWSDINGDRIIAGENRSLKMHEIDYVKVYFRMSTPYPKDEEVYLFGALSDWKIDERFKLKYEPEKNLYTTSVMLKQGYYNYYYVVKDPVSGQVDCFRFQGSHYETENDYLILIYMRSRFYQNWEIVAYAVLNSRGY